MWCSKLCKQAKAIADVVGSVAVQGLRSGPVGGDGQDLWGPQSPILYLATMTVLLMAAFSMVVHSMAVLLMF